MKQLIIGRTFGKTITAWVLLAAFMLPATVQLSNILDGHKHTVCTDKDTHIHQEHPDCAVCHFHFVPFQYNVADYFDVASVDVPTVRIPHFSPQQFSSRLKLHTRLRAPPQVLG